MSAIFACREAARLATQAIDHPLTFRGRLELHLHLAMCQACRTYRRQVILLDRLFRHHGGRPSTDGAGLEPAARERIHKVLQAAQEQRPGM